MNILFHKPQIVRLEREYYPEYGKINVAELLAREDLVAEMQMGQQQVKTEDDRYGVWEVRELMGLEE